MDKLANVDWGGMLKKATNKVKQYTLNLTDLELKVEDATSNETWGPHGSVMSGAALGWAAAAPTLAYVAAHPLKQPLPAAAEIADASFDFENYRQIMGVIARRLQEKASGNDMPPHCPTCQQCHAHVQHMESTAACLALR
jgi:hypothetical protein